MLKNLLGQVKPRENKVIEEISDNSDEERGRKDQWSMSDYQKLHALKKIQRNVVRRLARKASLISTDALTRDDFSQEEPEEAQYLNPKKIRPNPVIESFDDHFLEEEKHTVHNNAENNSCAGLENLAYNHSENKGTSLVFESFSANVLEDQGLDYKDKYENESDNEVFGDSEKEKKLPSEKAQSLYQRVLSGIRQRQTLKLVSIL